MISEIALEVERACKHENNKFGYGIWSHHIVSVVDYSMKLAEKIGADIEIVELAALFHDYASIKDFSMYKEHHIHSANEAEVILRKYDYPPDRIERVKDCISSHRGSIVVDKASKEATCIADADAIAHIVNVPSLLHLAYLRKNLSIDEGSRFVEGKINRSWAKLSDTAKELIEDRYLAAKLILKS